MMLKAGADFGSRILSFTAAFKCVMAKGARLWKKKVSTACDSGRV
jgi:hypothetical protein